MVHKFYQTRLVFWQKANNTKYRHSNLHDGACTQLRRSEPNPTKESHYAVKHTSLDPECLSRDQS